MANGLFIDTAFAIPYPKVVDSSLPSASHTLSWVSADGPRWRTPTVPGSAWLVPDRVFAPSRGGAATGRSGAGGYGIASRRDAGAPIAPGRSGADNRGRCDVSSSDFARPDRQ